MKGLSKVKRFVTAHPELGNLTNYFLSVLTKQQQQQQQIFTLTFGSYMLESKVFRVISRDALMLLYGNRIINLTFDDSGVKPQEMDPRKCHRKCLNATLK